jgi:hypothetical protein
MALPSQATGPQQPAGLPPRKFCLINGRKSYVTGGQRASARRAADPLVRRALRHWARRLPALHSLVFEGDGKREGRARQPEKSEVAGQHSVGSCRVVARGASEDGCRADLLRRSSHCERRRELAQRAETPPLRGLNVYDWLYTTGNSRVAEQTHLRFAETAQTHVLTGLSGNIAPYGVASNYHNVKILAGPDRGV